MKHGVCPVWIGYLLASPLRRMVHSPRRIVGPYVMDAMSVMDVGPGLGFFSLPMARLVGPSGRVVCVDVQAGMLERLTRRAQRAGLAERITTRLAKPDSLGVAEFAGQMDFVLAFAMVHEVPDAARLFKEIAAVLKPGGRLLIAEPKGHVTSTAFAETLRIADAAGLRPVETPVIRGTHAAVLEKSRPKPPGIYSKSGDRIRKRGR